MHKAQLTEYNLLLRRHAISSRYKEKLQKNTSDRITLIFSLYQVIWTFQSGFNWHFNNNKILWRRWTLQGFAR